MNPVQVTLSKAKELISDPDHWTKDNMFRSADGTPLYTTKDTRVECMCALGAVGMVCDIGDYTKMYRSQCAVSAVKVLDKAATILVPEHPNNEFIPGNNTWRFNDAKFTQHSDVLKLFDKAIALAAE